MALILLLAIPALLVGLTLAAMHVYNRYRNARLDSYLDDGDPVIGAGWKSPQAELPITNLFYQEVEKEFQNIYEKALAKFPKDSKNYYDEDVVHPKNEIAAWNEAVDHIEGFLRDKRVVHMTGMQNVDFLAQHQRRTYVEPVTPPKKRGSVVEEFMAKNKLTEEALVHIAEEKLREDLHGAKYKPSVDFLINTVNAQRIREDERKQLTQKFLKDLKEIQDKFVVEQEFLKSEVEDRDARLMQLVEERDQLLKKMEGMVPAAAVVVEPTIIVDGTPVSLSSHTKRKPAVVRKESQRGKRKPATKRKN